MSKLQARNETIISAPVSRIWAIITDIDMLPKVNRNVVNATGNMNTLNATRTCTINNRGRLGTATERMIELQPGKKTVWTVESDDMGMGKMLKNIRFCFLLEKVDDNHTRVINETWYTPANFIAGIMNALVIRKMVAKTQARILDDLTSLV
jgi:Polyketide cyclase / dehydrase and lipid transport